MLTIRIENQSFPFGAARQVRAIMRDAIAARLTPDDQLEYVYAELRKVLALSGFSQFFVTRGGHHVAIVATGYPHLRQALVCAHDRMPPRARSANEELEQLLDAARVIQLDARIRRYLEENDPNALEQLERAITAAQEPRS